MSRQEFDSFREAACLCGAGQITRHVESTDYPFGGANVSYTLDCPVCARDWRLDHGTLVNKQSEKEYTALSAELHALMAELVPLAAAMITSHFAALNLPSKKAELRALESLGLYNGTYAAYTKARREGEPIGKIVWPLRNEAWLVSVAGKDQRAGLEGALTQRAELEAAQSKAAAKIIRKRVLRG
ncbi:MAG: hypothetical protein ACPGJF_01430 [Sinimarinibacterium flocculans]|uniref:hypothetical protein n=1 Tax=Sinimarinibacterium flocculans TaxID=985250 RepID=UPI003C3AE413